MEGRSLECEERNSMRTGMGSMKFLGKISGYNGRKEAGMRRKEFHADWKGKHKILGKHSRV
jgi:hypothetical protein